MSVKPDIKSLTDEELAGCLQQWGQPAYRLAQVLQWVYARRATSWDAMTNLPKALREQLAQNFTHHPLELVRKQGARENLEPPLKLPLSFVFSARHVVLTC